MGYARSIIEDYFLDEEALLEGLIEECIEENFELLVDMNEAELDEFIGNWIRNRIAAKGVRAANTTNGVFDKAGYERDMARGVGTDQQKKQALTQRAQRIKKAGNVNFDDLVAQKRAERLAQMKQTPQQSSASAQAQPPSQAHDTEPTFDAGKNVNKYFAGRASGRARQQRAQQPLSQAAIMESNVKKLTESVMSFFQVEEEFPTPKNFKKRGELEKRFFVHPKNKNLVLARGTDGELYYANGKRKGEPVTDAE